jgi:NADP-dependent 3-hydroxy acid dehydrogenase YdfG
MKQLTDKVAIITGASSGIGEAAAVALAHHGARVALAARRIERLETLKQRIESEGGEAIAVKVDVTRRTEVENLVEKTLQAFGRIDILINNAGIMPLTFMKNLHVDEWERTIDVNVKGVLYGIAAVLPTMMEQKSGHIVNISSVAGRKVLPGGAVYSASKFAVGALSEGLRQELSPSTGIRVTIIEPGAVATELTQHITDEEVKESFSSYLTFERLTAEDIADAIVYAVTQPPNVSVNEVLIRPTRQPR